MRTIAPAKINWALEILRLRDDGYHEIKTVMQALGLHDTVQAEPASALELEATGEHIDTDENLVLVASHALLERSRRVAGARLRLVKRVPTGAGLGGGSSDAAAALRLLDRMWGLDLGEAALRGIAGGIGSDVPFFVAGGSALAEGRGERITRLPDIAPVWLVLLAPSIVLERKTTRMYAALENTDLTNGDRTDALAVALRSGGPITDDMLLNGFERVAYETFAELDHCRRALISAGARRVHLAGSGPALFCLADNEWHAREIAGRLDVTMGRTFVARTLSAADSTRIED